MFASFHARAIGLPLDASAVLEVAETAGFEGVDLLVRDLVESGADLAAVRRSMADRGLRPGAWPLPVDWRGDPGRYLADLSALPRLAEAAASLGFSRSATRVMSETPNRPGSDAGREAEVASTFALHVDRIGACAQILERHGSMLGLEVVGVESFRTGSGWPFLTRLADLGPLLDALRGVAGNVGVLVDGFHLHAAGEPVETALTWGVDRVAWVHVADLPVGFEGGRPAIQDGDRGLPGESGLVDSRSLLALLAASGYDGPVTAEPLGGCRSLSGLTPDAAASKVRSALGSVWPGNRSADGERLGRLGPPGEDLLAEDRDV